VRNPPSSRFTRFASRFARAERGATAVEFGLISLPILAMIFGLIELALVFLVATTLDQATQAASRQIRTGAFQTGAAPSRINFKALVCQNMAWLQSQCSSALWLDVQTFSTYAGLAGAPPVPITTLDPNSPTSGACFQPGQPGDIVLVRTYFQWNLMTPLLSTAFQNMGSGSGKRLISSATAFRNEPFNNNPPVGASCPTTP
jgi:Flp pilus assembly protein TadG